MLGIRVHDDELQAALLAEVLLNNSNYDDEEEFKTTTHEFQQNYEYHQTPYVY